MRAVGRNLSEKLVREFAENIEACPNMNVAMDILADAVGMLGYGRVCYSYLPTTRLPDGRWAPPPVLTRNYPTKWDVEWHRHSSNDPYYHACFEGTATVEWRGVQGRQDLSPLERDSLKYLDDKELHLGITVPVHLPGRRFAFVSALGNRSEDGWDELTMTTRDAIFVIGHYFHNVTFYKFKNPFPQRRQGDLSAREIECLKWAACGKTAEDIACILDRSIETVRIHLKRACAKLGAVNRVHAVAKACYLGLIEFPDC
jgi:DNA-binding CsgD family transcriptional regulator